MISAPVEETFTTTVQIKDEMSAQALERAGTHFSDVAQAWCVSVGEESQRGECLPIVHLCGHGVGVHRPAFLADPGGEDLSARARWSEPEALRRRPGLQQRKPGKGDFAEELVGRTDRTRTARQDHPVDKRTRSSHDRYHRRVFRESCQALR